MWKPQKTEILTLSQRGGRASKTAASSIEYTGMVRGGHCVFVDKELLESQTVDRRGVVTRHLRTCCSGRDWNVGRHSGTPLCSCRSEVSQHFSSIMQGTGAGVKGLLPHHDPPCSFVSLCGLCALGGKALPPSGRPQTDAWRV